ncbi:MAG: signal peptidase I [Firmicutes bacterium]|nr:signal peptidase I [Bacillota bacterium]
MKKQNEEIPMTGFQKVLEIVGDILFFLLLAAILVGAVLFASSRTPDKSIFGYRYYDVLTPSMEPAYSVGDLIFVKITKADAINVGDVITFNPGSTDDSYLTHRVTEKLENYQETGVTCFHTKGDANDSDDPFLIDESRVIGVVKAKVPLLGYIILFVQSYYIGVIIFVVLFVIFFNLIKKYAAVSAELKILEAEEAEEEEEEENKAKADKKEEKAKDDKKEEKDKEKSEK